jgi:hypothetical protein
MQIRMTDGGERGLTTRKVCSRTRQGPSLRGCSVLSRRQRMLALGGMLPSMGWDTYLPQVHARPARYMGLQRMHLGDLSGEGGKSIASRGGEVRVFCSRKMRPNRREPWFSHILNWTQARMTCHAWGRRSSRSKTMEHTRGRTTGSTMGKVQGNRVGQVDERTRSDTALLQAADAHTLTHTKHTSRQILRFPKPLTQRNVGAL